MIVGYSRHRNKNNEYQSNTVVYLRCDGPLCNKRWTTSYGNYSRKKVKKDYCISCRNRYGICGMKNKKHTDEFKKQVSERMLQNNPAKRPDVRNKLSQIMTGRKCPWLLGKSRPDHAEFMKKYMAKVMDPHNNFKNERRLKYLQQGRRNTKLHRDVKGSLIRQGYTQFESEYVIHNFVVDEYWPAKKIAIEVQGNFWHANPKKFQANDLVPIPGKPKTAQEIWDKDKAKREYLEQQGIRVIEVWESDFNENVKWKEIFGF